MAGKGQACAGRRGEQLEGVGTSLLLGGFSRRAVEGGRDTRLAAGGTDQRLVRVDRLGEVVSKVTAKTDREDVVERLESGVPRRGSRVGRPTTIVDSPSHRRTLAEQRQSNSGHGRGQVLLIDPHRSRPAEAVSGVSSSSPCHQSERF